MSRRNPLTAKERADLSLRSVQTYERALGVDPARDCFGHAYLVGHADALKVVASARARGRPRKMPDISVERALAKVPYFEKGTAKGAIARELLGLPGPPAPLPPVQAMTAKRAAQVARERKWIGREALEEKMKPYGANPSRLVVWGNPKAGGDLVEHFVRIGRQRGVEELLEAARSAPSLPEEAVMAMRLALRKLGVKPEDLPLYKADEFMPASTGLRPGTFSANPGRVIAVANGAVIQKRCVFCGKRMNPADVAQMSVKEANKIIGGLSEPGKMPGYGYGIPAEECKLGALLAKVQGSTCHGCYAKKGHYVMWDAPKAMARRLASISDPRWVDAFATRLRSLQKRGRGAAKKWFRWHDSGDLQGVTHLDKIVQVARKTPGMNHWLPTREYDMVRDWLAQHPEGLPKNLRVRLSAHYVGKAPANEAVALTRRDPQIALSAVHEKGAKPPSGFVVCEAKDRGNKCGPCRACWQDVPGVSYEKHNPAHGPRCVRCGHAQSAHGKANPYLLRDARGQYGFVPGVVYASKAAKSRVMAHAKRLGIKADHPKLKRGWWMFGCGGGGGRGRLNRLIVAVSKDRGLVAHRHQALDARTPYGTFAQCYWIVTTREPLEYPKRIDGEDEGVRRRKIDEYYDANSRATDMAEAEEQRLLVAARREQAAKRKKMILASRGKPLEGYGRPRGRWAHRATDEEDVFELAHEQPEAAKARRGAREAREVARKLAAAETKHALVAKRLADEPRRKAVYAARKLRAGMEKFGRVIDLPERPMPKYVEPTHAKTASARLAAARRSIEKELAGPRAGLRREEGQRILEEMRGGSVPRDPRARRQWAERLVGATILAHGKNPGRLVTVVQGSRVIRGNPLFGGAPKKVTGGIQAHKTFHGRAPKDWLKAEVPDSASDDLTLIGFLKKSEYETPRNSQRARERGVRTRWVHEAGDHGRGKPKTHPPALIADNKRRQVYIANVTVGGRRSNFYFRPSHGLMG